MSVYIGVNPGLGAANPGFWGRRVLSIYDFVITYSLWILDFVVGYDLSI